MKYLKKYNESTVSEWRNGMSQKSIEIHENDAKEFYVISPELVVTKYSIP
jgi:hypothetical protein